MNDQSRPRLFRRPGLGRRLIVGVLMIGSLLGLAGCNSTAATAVPTDAVVPATSTSTATSLPPTDTLEPTSTSTSTPTRAPTATSLPAGMLFTSGFDSKDVALKEGWSSSSGKDTSSDWSAGSLIISIEKPDLIAWNILPKFYIDFGAEVEAKPMGKGYIEYGLVFREDNTSTSNFYLFGVNTDGQYYLLKQVADKYVKPNPISLTASQYIKKGVAANKLSVVAEGSNLSLYVNGFLIRKFTDTSLSRGRVGVFVSTRQETTNKVAFDRFAVYTAAQAKTEWGTDLAAGGVTGASSASTPIPASPASTKAPTAPAVSKPAGTSVTVINSFPVSCLVVFWGPADLRLDASVENTAFSPINPGVYGWRSFLGGAETGEAGNLEIRPGDACVFICDKDTFSIRYGCH